MRAGVFLELLAEHYDVTLFVLQLFAWSRFAQDQRILSLCSNFIHYTPAKLKERGNTVPELDGIEFEHVHIFRLSMAQRLRHLVPGLKRRPYYSLDLDDYESQTQLRIAELYRANGLIAQAESVHEQAAVANKAELHIVPFFDAAYVCSEVDRQALQERFPEVRIRAIPNVVRIPHVPPAKEAGSAFRFLFVGTMAYYPNEDAALWFCRDVLPRLRDRQGDGLRILIAGRPTAAVAALADIPEVEVLGELESLETCYREADAVIVPIRAGGGTRIKILEAMSYGKPVVSTTVGAEGLECIPGTDLLIGDGAEQFATCCRRLMADKSKRSALASRGAEWVSKHHRIDNARRVLAKEIQHSLRSLT